MRSRRISLRGKLVRLGTRYFIRRRSRGQSVVESRAAFLAMERRVPWPPRGTDTVRVEAGGVPGDWISRPVSRRDRAVLYLHGGGYRVGSAVIYRHITWRIADALRARVLITDFRQAPEHPFPAALDDAVAAYRWLLQQAQSEVVVMGDSAGGGLALGLLMKLRDVGLKLPDAAVVMSPWTDLALTGASLATNAAADPMLEVSELPGVAADYLNGTDPRNPYASPLDGEARGLPPVLIQVGSDEILLDDAVRMAEKLGAANPLSELQVWPLMPHVWQAYAPVLPEARAAIADIGAFVRRVLEG